VNQYWTDWVSGNMQGPRMADGSFTWKMHDLRTHEPTGHTYCTECGLCWSCTEDHS
jgi:hypothetical protein